MKYRRYSDEEKAVAIAFLIAAGWKPDGSGPPGALTTAARKANVPHQRLSMWARETEAAPPPEIIQEKKAELSERIKALAHSVLDCLTDGRLEDAPVQSLFVGLGIAIEKLQLLNDQPTENVQQTIAFRREGTATLQQPHASGPTPDIRGVPAFQRGGVRAPVGQDDPGNGRVH